MIEIRNASSSLTVLLVEHDLFFKLNLCFKSLLYAEDVLLISL